MLVYTLPSPVIAARRGWQGRRPSGPVPPSVREADPTLSVTRDLVLRRMSYDGWG